VQSLLPPPLIQGLPPTTLPPGLRRERGRIYADSDGAELVYLPPDLPGSTGLYIDRHEVTNAQFQIFLTATASEGPRQPGSGNPTLPVVGVPWNMAVEYAAWAGRRLPTAREWERASGSGDGRKFPWGNLDDPSRRNGPGAEDLWPALSPVGTFPAGSSPFGCLDMSGNAWEWCSDRVHPPGALKTFDYRVLKGGGALWEGTDLLASAASGFLPTFQPGTFGVGFRLVRDE
jgi:formylglycine-generating enzyme required for sulfatase activity